MNRMTIAILLLAVVLAAAGLAWRFGTGSEVAGHGPASPNAPTSGPAQPEPVIAESRAPIEVAEPALQEPPVVPVVDATPVEPPAPVLDGAAAWEAHYKDLPRSALEGDLARLNAEIQDMTAEEMQQRMAQGLGEYLGEGNSISGDDWDQSAIMIMELGARGKIQVKLSREEFPEAYALKDQAVWLQKEIWRLPKQ